MNPQFGAPNFVLTNFLTSGEVTATSELLIPAIEFSSLHISSMVLHLSSIVSTGSALARATNRGASKGQGIPILKSFHEERPLMMLSSDMREQIANTAGSVS